MPPNKAVHSFRNSAYPRRTNEGYYTEPWVTRCLLPYIPADIRGVIDPAAGRGDILRVMREEEFSTKAADIDTQHFDPSLGTIKQQNFFESTLAHSKISSPALAIITNPPYGGARVLYDGKKPPIAEAFLRHALKQDVRFVAMLLRTDFNHSVRRTDLFRNNDNYAFEVSLLNRPVWDWWLEKKPGEKKSHPQHNFSWFCWDREHIGASTQYWMGRKDVDPGDESVDTEWEE